MLSTPRSEYAVVDAIGHWPVLTCAELAFQPGFVIFGGAMVLRAVIGGLGPEVHLSESPENGHLIPADHR